MELASRTLPVFRVAVASFGAALPFELARPSAFEAAEEASLGVLGRARRRSRARHVWSELESAKPPRPMILTGKQNRHLRALGHHTEPVVQLGKAGLTDAARDAVSAALTTHELVKVRVGTECPEDPQELAERLAPAVSASLVQRLGRTILLYRPHPKKPKIVLPAKD